MPDKTPSLSLALYGVSNLHTKRSELGREQVLKPVYGSTELGVSLEDRCMSLHACVCVCVMEGRHITQSLSGGPNGGPLTLGGYSAGCLVLWGLSPGVLAGLSLVSQCSRQALTLVHPILFSETVF